MAKKKYYAVQVGRIPGIYGTWDECKAQTEGVSGAKHKTFSSLEEAERYVRGANDDALDAESTTPLSKDDLNSQVEKAVAALAENEIIAFVDSSKYITPCEDIVKLANSFIRQKSDILSNSMLSNAAQAILLRS